MQFSDGSGQLSLAESRLLEALSPGEPNHMMALRREIRQATGYPYSHLTLHRSLRALLEAGLIEAAGETTGPFGERIPLVRISSLGERAYAG
jgi:DNA-binding PadR family transcriptional regulator